MNELKKERLKAIKDNINIPLGDMINNYNITKFFNKAKDKRGAIRKCMAREGYRVVNGYFELIKKEVEPVEVQPTIEEIKKIPQLDVNDDLRLSIHQELFSPLFSKFIEDIVKSKIETKVEELKNAGNEGSYINTDLSPEYNSAIIKSIRVNKKAYDKLMKAIERNPFTRDLTKTRAMTILFLKLAETLDK